MTTSPDIRPAATVDDNPRQTDPRAIWVENLTKTFADVHALDGVTLEVRRGEVFGLLGPNGAGKTTLVETLEGHVSPTSGTVRVLGMEPLRAKRAIRDRLGIVPQKASFELYLNVREHIEVFAGYYDRCYDVDELIELVGLTSKARTLTGRLSGGQQRRLDLALALVGDPDVVFLDEPTTGLDVEARDRAWETINAMRQMGKTIFLTTHNMVEAQHLCDRVAVLDHGRVAAVGKPRELLPDAGGGAVVFLLSASDQDDLPAHLRRDAVVDGERVTIQVGDSARALHDLTGWALERGIRLVDLEVRRPDLEELYLSILARQAEAQTAIRSEGVLT